MVCLLCHSFVSAPPPLWPTLQVGDVAPYVQKILALGATASATDDEGWTALHWAAYHGNLSGATALCSYTASSGGVTAVKSLVSLQDLEGKTALDLAKEELDEANSELKELQVRG